MCVCVTYGKRVVTSSSASFYLCQDITPTFRKGGGGGAFVTVLKAKASA